MTFSLILFYILLILLPTQLGRHFFFEFSQIQGIPIDYLVPTLYLTDIISVILVIHYFLYKIKNLRQRRISLWLKKSPPKADQPLAEKIKSTSKKLKEIIYRNKLLIFISLFLILNSIFIASNHWAAFYKSFKIMEFILLGITIAHLKPKLDKVILFLSIGAFYSSVLAVWQFILQKSVGGLWWFLGERTFYAGTPGIASVSIGNALILRPYATFPHPNVLGGFLAIILTSIFYLFLKPINIYKRIWYFVVFIMGLTGLILSFGKVAWIMFVTGILTIVYNVIARILSLSKGTEKSPYKQKKLFVKLLLIFYLSIFISIFGILAVSPNFLNLGKSFQERQELLGKTISLAVSNPVFGTGLNNSLIQVEERYFFQPVHNIYLLVLTETGTIGLFIFLFYINTVLIKSFKKNPLIFTVIVQMLLLGFFDHYLLTLQQGMLIFTLFTSLALSADNS